MRWLSILSVLALGACGLDVPADVGEKGQGPGSDPAPGSDSEVGREYFDAHIAPLLATSCVACHVGPENSPMNNFLGPDPDAGNFYPHVTNDRALTGDFNPSASRLLTKGVHAGPAWTGDQAQEIVEWLELEATLRSPPPTNGDGLDQQTQIRLLEEAFAACMGASQQEFDQTMAPILASMPTANGTCATCHADAGAGGAFFALDSQAMLGKWQQQVYFEAILQVNPQGNGSLSVGLADNLCSKGIEMQAGMGDHPAYDCTTPVGGVVPVTAIDAFRAALQDKYDRNACPPPGFAPPD